MKRVKITIVALLSDQVFENEDYSQLLIPESAKEMSNEFIDPDEGVYELEMSAELLPL